MSRDPEDIAYELAQKRYQEKRRDKYICAALKGVLASSDMKGTPEELTATAVCLADLALKKADE